MRPAGVLKAGNRSGFDPTLAAIFRVATLLVVGLTPFFAADASAEQTVRIAVGRFRDPLTVTGADVKLVGSDGTQFKTKGPIVLSPSSRGLRLHGKEIPGLIVHLRSPKTLRLRGHEYHGHLEVSWRSYRGRPELLVVHPLPLETYVLGVVSSELPKKWPLEALKAQAIAARTYAIWQKFRRLELPYHMESSVLDQVYHGAQREHPDAKRAVAETYGQVMTYGRRPAQAYFHAACGGRTESAKAGWGNALPYLPGSKCGYCNDATRYRWKASVTKDAANRKLRPLLGADVDKIVPGKKTKSGRLKTVTLVGAGKRPKKRSIQATDLRRLLGYTKVWSTKIDKVTTSTKSFSFAGKGAGHGVGMCQWGARGMAHKGKTVGDILQNYYPGTKLSRLY